MAVVTALAAGGVLGVRHALEADHLAAVATLGGEDDPGVVGVSWGVGHTAPVLALGLAFVGLGVAVPAAVTRAVEGVVGVALVAYGLRLLGEVAGLLAGGSHGHGEPTGGRHDHLRVGRVSLGATHAHLDGDSLAVGALHGLAGSGALVVAAASTAPGVGTALAFLLAFGAATTLTMGAVSRVWGRTLDAGSTRGLKLVAGALGVAVGAALVAEVALGLAVLP